MSEITRRDVLQRLALAIAAAGAIDALDAREAHAAARQAAAAAGGKYAPKALSAHEFATLERLTDLIIPADDKPGALQADVAPWIDMLLNVNADLKAKYTTGLAWLDAAVTADGREGFRRRDAGAAGRAARRDRLQEEPHARERRRASTSSCWRGA